MLALGCHCRGFLSPDGAAHGLQTLSSASLLSLPACLRGTKTKPPSAGINKSDSNSSATPGFSHLRKWKSFFHLLRYHLCLLSHTHLSLAYLTFRIYAGRDQLLSPPPPVLTPAWSSLLDNCGGLCPPTIHRLPEGPSLYRNPDLEGDP